MSSPIDLTNLADCKAWLGVTSSTDDALIGELVTAISQAILADLGRASILPAVYTETFDGAGESAITLRQWPVTSVSSCTVDGVAISVSTMPGQTGYVLDAPDLVPPGGMQRVSLRGGFFPRGVQNVTISYRAGYEIDGETAVVPGASPYNVVALAPFGLWAVDAGIGGLTAPYNVAGGVYTFTVAVAGMPVTLNYGYIPADLARAACEWVTERYVSRTRIGQSAKTLGGQETTSFIVKAMPDVVSRLLQPYRRVAR